MQQSGSVEVRTKVATLEKEFDEQFFCLLEQLRNRSIDCETFQNQMRQACSQPDLHNSLLPALERLDQSNPAEWLVRRHVGSCRYTVQVYILQPSTSQAPHQHHNLISTHVVLQGRVHLREYERVKKDTEDNLLLQPVRDEILEAGDMFQASEWSNNVHWFGAVDVPALMFSVDARGYEQTTFHSDNDDQSSFGRRYLDPTVVDNSGHTLGVCLAETVAKSRFGNRPLSDFPGPDVVSNDTITHRKSA